MVKVETHVLWSGATGGVPGGEQKSSGALLRGHIYFWVPKYPEGVSVTFWAILDNGWRHELGTNSASSDILITSHGLNAEGHAAIEVNSLTGVGLSSIEMRAETPEEELVKPFVFTQWDLGFPNKHVIPHGQSFNVLRDKPQMLMAVDGVAWGTSGGVLFTPKPYNRVVRFNVQCSMHFNTRSVGRWYFQLKGAKDDDFITQSSHTIARFNDSDSDALPVTQCEAQLVIPKDSTTHQAVTGGIALVYRNLTWQDMSLENNAKLTVTVHNVIP